MHHRASIDPDAHTCFPSKRLIFSFSPQSNLVGLQNPKKVPLRLELEGGGVFIHLVELWLNFCWQSISVVVGSSASPKGLAIHQTQSIKL